MVDELLADLPPDRTEPEVFWGEQFDRGLAWVHFPVGRGGLGVSARAPGPGAATHPSRPGATSPGLRNIIGYGMVAPTLVAHGTDEQRIATCARSSPARRSGASSSPSPAPARTWPAWPPGPCATATSGCSTARRSGPPSPTWPASVCCWPGPTPTLPKHRGITCFLVDMHAPGVEVRPLYQITGEAEFNEVFFTDVRVPDADRLGEVGEGWQVAVTTLMNERVSIGGNVAPRSAGPIGDALRIWRERWSGQTSAHALALRDQLMQLWVHSRGDPPHQPAGLRASPRRHPGARGLGRQAGLRRGEPADLRAVRGPARRRGHALQLGLPQDARPSTSRSATTDVHKAFLRVRANSIEGGTSEVMRNILGERVLGLPRRAPHRQGRPLEGRPAQLSRPLEGRPA